jgi:hypothetical protein
MSEWTEQGGWTGTKDSILQQVRSWLGSLSSLTTTAKSTLVAAINEVRVAALAAQSGVAAIVAENTDGVICLSLTDYLAVSGAWTPSRTGPGVYKLQRTAGTGIDILAIRVPALYLRSSAGKGRKVTGALLHYQIATADVADVSVALARTTMPAHGVAVANAVTLGTISYDGNHDTSAKRKTLGNHTMQATIASPAYLSDGWITIEVTVNGTGAGTALFSLFLLELLTAETLVEST